MAVTEMLALNEPEPQDQEVVEQQFIKSASRSAGSKKAWETRRKKKAEVAPVQAWLTAEQARRIKNLTSQVFEKREALTAAQNELEDAESTLTALIDSLTAKEK